MSSQAATKADHKRLTIRMIRLQDEFRAVEDRVKIMESLLISTRALFKALKASNSEEE